MRCPCVTGAVHGARRQDRVCVRVAPRCAAVCAAIPTCSCSCRRGLARLTCILPFNPLQGEAAALDAAPKLPLIACDEWIQMRATADDAALLHRLRQQWQAFFFRTLHPEQYNARIDAAVLQTIQRMCGEVPAQVSAAIARPATAPVSTPPAAPALAVATARKRVPSTSYWSPAASPRVPEAPVTPAAVQPSPPASASTQPELRNAPPEQTSPPTVAAAVAPQLPVAAAPTAVPVHPVHPAKPAMEQIHTASPPTWAAPAAAPVRPMFIRVHHK